MLDKENKGNKDIETKENLTGFFELLLKVDKRTNPHLYEADSSENNNLSNKFYDRHDNP